MKFISNITFFLMFSLSAQSGNFDLLIKDGSDVKTLEKSLSEIFEGQVTVINYSYTWNSHILDNPFRTYRMLKFKVKDGDGVSTELSCLVAYEKEENHMVTYDCISSGKKLAKMQKKSYKGQDNFIAEKVRRPAVTAPSSVRGGKTNGSK